ncbi:MAG TPA: methionine adenosyltransferase domain-containing protein, partial [Ferruginibacter sp.]|nr:methionine adenosyltransferase domain-containing protein [Ferruginibacter sp.]
IAKNLVAAGLCDEVLVQVSYAIGVAEPTSINVNTYGTAKVKLTDGEIAQRVMKMACFDMRPYFIEKRLKLRNPMYSETAAYGHMGRTNKVVEKTFTSPDGKMVKRKVELFTWEKLDAVKDVKKVFGLK